MDDQHHPVDSHVQFSDAGSEEAAVVIVARDASVAFRAVLGSIRLFDSAAFAESSGRHKDAEGIISASTGMSLDQLPRLL